MVSDRVWIARKLRCGGCLRTGWLLEVADFYTLEAAEGVPPSLILFSLYLVSELSSQEERSLRLWGGVPFSYTTQSLFGLRAEQSGRVSSLSGCWILLFGHICRKPLSVLIHLLNGDIDFFAFVFLNEFSNGFY